MPRTLPAIALCCLATLAGAVAPAEATTITFEGFGANTTVGDLNVANGLEVAIFDGYGFTSSGDHFHIGDGLTGVPSNNTSILLEDRDYFIEMLRMAGGSFSLLTADFGEDLSALGSASKVRVTGYFAAGGSIVAEVLLDGNTSTFQNMVFVGFTDLVRVAFDGLGNSSPSINANGFAMDNVVVEVVPEPGTVLLVGLGLTAALVRRFLLTSSKSASTSSSRLR